MVAENYYVSLSTRRKLLRFTLYILAENYYVSLSTLRKLLRFTLYSQEIITFHSLLAGK